MNDDSLRTIFMLPLNEVTAKIKEIPLVSVIIPTYNRAALLKEALDSVYAQEEIGKSFDMEVIVVDDASTDATVEVVNRYATVNYIRHEKNRGASAARNAGIKAATGKYIAFLDDDDIFLPHKLKVQVPVLENRPDIGVLYGQISVSGESFCEAWPEFAPSGNVFESLIMRTDDFMSPDALLVRREAFEKAGCFDESLPTMEHYDMYVRLAFHVPFLFVPGPVAHGRFSKRGKWNTNILNGGNERTLPRIIENALQMLPDTPESERIRRKARLAVFSTIAEQRWCNGGSSRVRDHLLATLQTHLWIVAEPAFLDNVRRVASSLAAASNNPIATARTFFAEVKNAAGYPDLEPRSKARQLWAAILHGTAVGLWSIGSYRPAGQMALRAIFRDPKQLRQKDTWSILGRAVLGNSHWKPVVAVLKRALRGS